MKIPNESSEPSQLLFLQCPDCEFFSASTECCLLATELHSDTIQTFIDRCLDHRTLTLTATEIITLEAEQLYVRVEVSPLFQARKHVTAQVQLVCLSDSGTKSHSLALERRSLYLLCLSVSRS